MSPSESELRSALHDGEDADTPGVDVDRVIATAHARHSQRRVRLLSAAAVVAVVGGAATGGALLRGNDGSGPHSSGADQQKLADRAAGGAAGARSGSSNSTTDASSACPTSLPRQVLPGGGSSGQFGSGGPLFARATTSLILCSYGIPTQLRPSAAGPEPARLVLTGTRADELRASLENAPKRRPAVLCPMLARADQREVTVIGVTADGSTLPTVTTALNEIPCQVTVSNGTAVRYDWSPPADLAGVLASLTPKPVRTSPTRPVMHGSPIHS